MLSRITRHLKNGDFYTFTEVNHRLLNFDDSNVGNFACGPVTSFQVKFSVEVENTGRYSRALWNYEGFLEYSRILEGSVKNATVVLRSYGGMRSE